MMGMALILAMLGYIRRRMEIGIRLGVISTAKRQMMSQAVAYQ